MGRNAPGSHIDLGVIIKGVCVDASTQSFAVLQQVNGSFGMLFV